MNVLMVLTLASRQGAYGGPFTSAVNDALALRRLGLTTHVVAGHYADDEPHGFSRDMLRLARVRKQVPILDYKATFSFSLFRLLVREIKNTDLIIISFSREVTPIVTAIL